MILCVKSGQHLLGASKNSTKLEVCGIDSIRLIFKTKMLIYQSKVNLDVKILFDNIIHHIDLEMRKGFMGTKIPHSILA